MSEPGAGYEAYAGLRRLALEMKPESVGLTAPVFGAVMELRVGGGVATLVAFANGETSLYFSNGGGIVGAGQRSEKLADAAKAFVAVAATVAERLPLNRNTTLPSTGMTMLHVLTSSGRRLAEEWEADLQEPSHELHSLYAAGQRVITAIRPVMAGS